MKRAGWIVSALVVLLVVLVLLMFGTDLKYRVADLCNHTGGELRTCVDVFVLPFEPR